MPQRNCLYCNEIFYPPEKEIKRGNGQFCNRSHSAKYKGLKTRVVVDVTCAFCGISFKRNPRKLYQSKSGLHFCTREHKDLAQRIGGIKEIQPSHFGTIGRNYRTTAFRIYEKKCADCGYDEFPEILQVHHIDEDRSNNKPENLVVLCPNHHALRHRGIVK